MDCTTTTDDLSVISKAKEENILLDVIKETISEENDKMSSNVRAKVNRIISDSDLTQYSNFHKLTTADESTSTLFGKNVVLQSCERTITLYYKTVFPNK